MGLRAPTGAWGCQPQPPGCCCQGPGFWTCPSQSGHHAQGGASAVTEGGAWPGAGRFVMHNII